MYLDFASILNNAYATLAKYNLSVTSLIVIMVLLCLAFLFSVREAASWFFKVDNVNREVKRLRRSVDSMEEQIRALTMLLDKSLVAQAPTLPKEPVATEPAAKKGLFNKPTQPNFPINH